MHFIVVISETEIIADVMLLLVIHVSIVMRPHIRSFALNVISAPRSRAACERARIRYNTYYTYVHTLTLRGTLRVLLTINCSQTHVTHSDILRRSKSFYAMLYATFYT